MEVINRSRTKRYVFDDSFFAHLDTMPLFDDPSSSINMLMDDPEPFYPIIGMWMLEIGGGHVTILDDTKVPLAVVDSFFSDQL